MNESAEVNAALAALRRQRRGTFRVMRNCCTSGNCVECRGVKPYGTPVRVEQGSGYSKEYAEQLASNWSSYKATVEPMPLH